MNLEYLIILTTLFSIIFMLIQRSEAKKRMIVTLALVIPMILIRNFAVYRDVQQEAWIGLGIALIFNFMFWVLIGRYNPVPSSDEIQVLGLDD